MTDNIEFHEYANLFPMMDALAFAELKRDIQENGLLEPVVIYDGKILDGRNRYTACLELGIEPDYEHVNGNTDPLKYVISKNLKRRHLNESQRAVVAAKLANMPSGYRTDRPNANLHEVVSKTAAAELLNVSPRTVATVKAVEKVAPELIAKIERGEMSAHEAEKKVKEMRRFEQQSQLVKIADSVPVSDRWSIRQADIQTAQLEPNTIDAIITDPPYPKEYLPLWSDLAKFAKRHLKIGGVLLAMTPAPYLPEIMEMLGEHLKYQWIMACVLPGSHGSVIQSGVRNVCWKPILVYRNGGDPVNIGSDMFENDKRDKDFHEWGQGVGGYLWQIENFTNPNDLVCDPFLGGGTTAIAALQLKRRFIGFDCDAEKVAIAKGRLSHVTL